MNETKEALRYFIFGSKWLHRVRKSFNNLFDNCGGRLLKQHIKGDALTLRFCYRSDNNEIQSTIDRNYQVFYNFENSMHDDRIFTFNEALYGLRSLLYYTSLKKLSIFTRALSSRFILLKGTAGNGKTNLLCSTVQYLIGEKNPVVFINSVDVKNDVYDHILSSMGFSQKLAENNHLILLLMNLWMIIRRKRIYIVIDAINENDGEKFRETLCKSIKLLMKYSKVYFILSCRSEYFQERYAKLFGNDEGINPFIFDIHNLHYSKRALDKLHAIYQKHFRVSGSISNMVKGKLSRSLLLTRIFYEVNANNQSSILTLNKFDIFKQYVESVENGKEAQGFNKLLEKLVSHMVFSGNYDRVLLEHINLTDSENKLLKRVADQNMLINVSIVLDAGNIAERTKEYVTFAFDELRDYCISRFQIIQYSDGQTDATQLLNFIFDLQEKTMSPAEGITRYTYHFLRAHNDYSLCRKILEKCHEKSWRKVNDHIPPDERDNEFHDLGMSIIYDGNEDIYDFEKTYTTMKLIDEHKPDASVFFGVLLNNQLMGLRPDMTLYNELLFDIASESELMIAIDILPSPHNEFYDITIPKILAKMGEINSYSFLLFLLTHDLIVGNGLEFDNIMKQEDIDKALHEIKTQSKCADLVNHADQFHRSPNPKNVKELLKKLFPKGDDI